MGVLDNIRVIELCGPGPGEFLGMMLADMGADVIKIENGSDHRLPRTDVQQRRRVFEFRNRNKRSMILDLKATEGQALFKRLIAGADVLSEGFRPGVLQRLGADYETLHAVNPRLVYSSLSGYGQDGPYRDLPGHDVNYLSQAGVLALIGTGADGKPVIPTNIIGDYAGATLHGVIGILLALFGRERSGRGQHVDVAYLDSTLSLAAATPNLGSLFSDGISTTRGKGGLGGSFPYYTVYETRDGKFLSMGSTEPKRWARFCELIGRPDLAKHARQLGDDTRSATAEEEAARRAVESIMKTKDRDAWFELLAREDICVGKVLEPDELHHDPQIRHRQMVVETQHPRYGRITQFGIAIKLSETPGSVRHVAPLPGEHTEQILRELRLDENEIAALRKGGVVQ